VAVENVLGVICTLHVLRKITSNSHWIYRKIHNWS